MRQFLNGHDMAFADLERQARSACVVFGNAEMPSGTTPPRARIGFEVDPASGAAVLLVERGLTYAGSVDSVWEWLATGEKRFRSFRDLANWIRGELAASFTEGCDAEIEQSDVVIAASGTPDDPIGEPPTAASMERDAS